MISLSIPALVLLGGGTFHVPHDPVDDIAVGPNFRDGIGHEVVLCANAASKVSRSYNNALSWEALGGEELQQFQCTQVEYWGDASNPRYFIGTTEGVWIYDPIADTVVNYSAGLPLIDNYVVSMSAPQSGLGTEVLLTNKGGV